LEHGKGGFLVLIIVMVATFVSKNVNGMFVFLTVLIKGSFECGGSTAVLALLALVGILKDFAGNLI